MRKPGGYGMRKPGGSKLVYDRKTRTIKKIRINRWKRFLWWVCLKD